MKFNNIVVHDHNTVTANRTGFWFNLFKNVFNWREEYRWEQHDHTWYLMPERTRVHVTMLFWLDDIVEDQQAWEKYGKPNE